MTNPTKTQDIVERLRSPATLFCEHKVDECALLHEAADTIESLRARVVELEAGGDIFDADDHKFREVFEYTCKNNNLTVTQKGFGYRSPITDWCNRIAFEVVNRLKLYKTPPTVEAEVAAALRKAAETARDLMMHGPHGERGPQHIYEAIRAIPRNDSALRDGYMKVATNAWGLGELCGRGNKPYLGEAIINMVDKVLKGE